MDWLKKLIAYSESRRLLLLCLDKSTSDSLNESRRGPGRFSLTARHDVFDALRPPCLCLVYFNDDTNQSARLGIAESKRAVTTLDSAVRVAFACKIKPSTPSRLIDSLSKKVFRTRVREQLQTEVSVLPKGLSREVVNQLVAVDANGAHLKRLAFHLFGEDALEIRGQMQKDAIELALAAFGMDKHALAASITPTGQADGALQFYEIDERILEDNVIAHDARAVPGYNLIESDATGHAVFVSGRERLDIYTANRGPLEKAFGVDLLYVNVSKQNVVMVQYKMLEREESEDDDEPPTWAFRPDRQFYAEKSRMAVLRQAASSGDYRLNAEPFYFKFAKRFQDRSQGSLLLPLEHLDLFLTSDDAKGPKGGVRVCYEGLKGRYLRETEFLGLIRSGYIGTYVEETKFLVPLIKAIIKGKKALVYAVQRGFRGHP